MSIKLFHLHVIYIPLYKSTVKISLVTNTVLSKNTDISDTWSELYTSLSLYQSKWQSSHLKCMNILCNAQRCSSPTSWCIHPWGTMIGIYGQSYGHGLNYESHYRKRGQRSSPGLVHFCGHLSRFAKNRKKKVLGLSFRLMPTRVRL